MAKNVAGPKPKSGNGVAKDSAPEQPESLDQVRDILFGGQMRMVDARLRSLEERIALEQTTLRNDLSKKIAELEEASKKEFAAHADRLSTERAKRADDLKALSAELKESLKNLERRHVKFEEATSLADAEVRDQLMRHSAAFSAELSRTSERLTTELDRAASSLRADKVDTTTLAATLNEMATKLTGGGAGRPPNKGNTKS
jgi:methyl-accepting chemotaxis protein